MQLFNIQALNNPCEINMLLKSIHNILTNNQILDNVRDIDGIGICNNRQRMGPSTENQKLNSGKELKFYLSSQHYSKHQ